MLLRLLLWLLRRPMALLSPLLLLLLSPLLLLPLLLPLLAPLRLAWLRCLLRTSLCVLVSQSRSVNA